MFSFFICPFPPLAISVLEVVIASSSSHFCIRPFSAIPSPNSNSATSLVPNTLKQHKIEQEILSKFIFCILNSLHHQQSSFSLLSSLSCASRLLDLSLPLPPNIIITALSNQNTTHQPSLTVCFYVIADLTFPSLDYHSFIVTSFIIMAERWLGFAPRSHTHISQAKSAEQTWYEPPEDSPTHCLHHQPKPHVLSRMSSYLTLGSAARAPTPPMWDAEKSQHYNVENLIRESDKTWHNPSLIQMVETVGCSLMANGIHTPIPRELNTYVASMIEQFRILDHRDKVLRGNVKNLKHARENDRKEFKAASDDWKQRELDFKAEIKRLELVIMETNPGKGLEKVLLNRRRSVVNRNDTKRFSARLDKLSSGETEGMMTLSSISSQRCNTC